MFKKRNTLSFFFLVLYLTLFAQEQNDGIDDIGSISANEIESTYDFMRFGGIQFITPDDSFIYVSHGTNSISRLKRSSTGLTLEQTLSVANSKATRIRSAVIKGDYIYACSRGNGYGVHYESKYPELFFPFEAGLSEFSENLDNFDEYQSAGSAYMNETGDPSPTRWQHSLLVHKGEGSSDDNYCSLKKAWKRSGTANFSLWMKYDCECDSDVYLPIIWSGDEIVLSLVVSPDRHIGLHSSSGTYFGDYVVDDEWKAIKISVKYNNLTLYIRDKECGDWVNVCDGKGSIYGDSFGIGLKTESENVNILIDDLAYNSPDIEDYLFRNGELTVIDKRTLEVLSTYQLNMRCLDLLVDGDYLYLGMIGGLNVYDLSDPIHPKLCSINREGDRGWTYPTASMKSNYHYNVKAEELQRMSIASHDGVKYLAAGSDAWGVLLYDITNPLIPKLTERVNIVPKVTAYDSNGNKRSIFKYIQWGCVMDYPYIYSTVASNHTLQHNEYYDGSYTLANPNNRIYGLMVSDISDLDNIKSKIITIDESSYPTFIEPEGDARPNMLVRSGNTLIGNLSDKGIMLFDVRGMETKYLGSRNMPAKGRVYALSVSEDGKLYAGDLTVANEWNERKLYVVNLDHILDSLSYVNNYNDALISAKSTATSGSKMSGWVLDNLKDAISANEKGLVDETDRYALESATDALNSANTLAKKSIESYRLVEEGTIPCNTIEGWTCTTCDSLSVGIQSDAHDVTGQESDITFMEVLPNSDSFSIGQGKVYYHLEGLEPGEIYQVSAIIGSSKSASSGNMPELSFYVNTTNKEIVDFDSEIVTDGIIENLISVKIGDSVGTDGVLEFGLEVLHDNLQRITIERVSLYSITDAFKASEERLMSLMDISLIPSTLMSTLDVFITETTSNLTTADDYIRATDALNAKADELSVISAAYIPTYNLFEAAKAIYESPCTPSSRVHHATYSEKYSEAVGQFHSAVSIKDISDAANTLRAATLDYLENGIPAYGHEYDVTLFYLASNDLSSYPVGTSPQGWYTDQAEGILQVGRGMEQSPDLSYVELTSEHPMANGNFNIYQLAHLPSGTYRMTSMAGASMADGEGSGQVYFCANDSLGTKVGSPFSEVSISSFVIDDGPEEVMIGLRALDGNNLRLSALSDINIYKQTDVDLAQYLTAYQTAIATAKEIATSESKISKLVLNDLCRLIDKYDEGTVDEFDKTSLMEAAQVLSVANTLAQTSINNYKLISTGEIPCDTIGGWICTTGDTLLVSAVAWDFDDAPAATVPSIEVLPDEGSSSLGCGKLCYRLEGLEPGETYYIQAKVRSVDSDSGLPCLTDNDPPTSDMAFYANGNEINMKDSGITFSLDDLSGIHLSAGLLGTVDDDGILDFGLKIPESMSASIAINDVHIQLLEEMFENAIIRIRSYEDDTMLPMALVLTIDNFVKDATSNLNSAEDYLTAANTLNSKSDEFEVISKSYIANTEYFLSAEQILNTEFTPASSDSHSTFKDDFLSAINLLQSSLTVDDIMNSVAALKAHTLKYLEDGIPAYGHEYDVTLFYLDDCDLSSFSVGDVPDGWHTGQAEGLLQTGRGEAMSPSGNNYVEYMSATPMSNGEFNIYQTASLASGCYRMTALAGASMPDGEGSAQVYFSANDSIGTLAGSTLEEVEVRDFIIEEGPTDVNIGLRAMYGNNLCQSAISGLKIYKLFDVDLAPYIKSYRDALALAKEIANSECKIARWVLNDLCRVIDNNDDGMVDEMNRASLQVATKSLKDAISLAQTSIGNYELIAANVIPCYTTDGWVCTTGDNLQVALYGEDSSVDSEAPVPSIEVMPQYGESSISSGRLYYRLEGLEPGESYQVEAMIRSVESSPLDVATSSSPDDAADESENAISSLSFYVNEESIDLKESGAIFGSDDTSCSYAAISLLGTVDEDGLFEFGLEISEGAIHSISLEGVMVKTLSDLVEDDVSKVRYYSDNDLLPIVFTPIIEEYIVETTSNLITTDDYFTAIDRLNAKADELGVLSNTFLKHKEIFEAAKAILETECEPDCFDALSLFSEDYDIAFDHLNYSMTIEEMEDAAIAVKAATLTYLESGIPAYGLEYDITLFYLDDTDLSGYASGSIPHGWQTGQEDGLLQIGNDKEISPEGNNYVEYLSDIPMSNGEFNIYQSVNLPLGCYRLTALASASMPEGEGSAQVYFSADDQGVKIGESFLSSAEIKNFVVEEGGKEVTIGLKAQEGNNICHSALSDVKIYKVNKPTVTIDENSPFELVNMKADIVLKRTIKVGINTVVLPFSLTKEEIDEAFGAGTRIFTLGYYNQTSGYLYLERIEDINANEPFVLIAKKAGKEYFFPQRQIQKCEPENIRVDTDGASLLGFYDDIMVPYGSYVISGGSFYYVNSPVKLKTTRAYFILDKGDEGDEVDAKGIKLFFDDGDATVISLVESAREGIASGQIYDLNGREVDTLGKGTYIIDGKKVFVRH